MMILTNCAACAVPLPRPAKQCSRCKTLYCGPACQKEHWERGGHDALCRKIKKGGGAEQHHAEKKYKELLAEAAEKCADDTAGQIVATSARRPSTGKRRRASCACACRGTAGIRARVVLGEQAKRFSRPERGRTIWTGRYKNILVIDYRWGTCSLCEQNYHGVVMGALGWACWKFLTGAAGGRVQIIYLA